MVKHRLRQLTIIITSIILVNFSATTVLAQSPSININTDDNTGLGAVLIALCLGSGILTAVLPAVWVMFDASSRDRNGVLWGLFVLLTQMVGLLIYLFVVYTSKDDERMACMKCGFIRDATLAHCPKCGHTNKAMFEHETVQVKD